MTSETSSRLDFSAAGNKAQENAAARHIIYMQRNGECPEQVAAEWHRVGLPVVRRYRSLDLN